jgi:transcriptional regulator with XRE-family HTH domain
MLRPVDVVRVDLSFRALRLRRRWRQQDLADRVDVARSVIARVERGGADSVTLRLLDRIAQRLDARLDVRLLWQGEGLDRLLDARHAAVVEAVVRTLAGLAWLTSVEVSFNIRGERGGIDVLAFHPSTRSLLVIEVKSVGPDIQAMLLTLDRKLRLAREIARERGWEAGSVSVVLVLPEDRTARRRLAAVGGTIRTALPSGNIAIRRWLKRPAGTIRGVWFLSDVSQAGTRHRAAVRTRPPVRESAARS